MASFIGRLWNFAKFPKHCNLAKNGAIFNSLGPLLHRPLSTLTSFTNSSKKTCSLRLVSGPMNAVETGSLLPAPGAGPVVQQTRGRYLCWRMKRDVRKRAAVAKYATDRLRINALRKSTLLPREIVEMADEEIKKFPRDSCRSVIHDRCVLTSRSKGLVKPHNVSRIMFRILADYNKMSGMMRAKWGP